MDNRVVRHQDREGKLLFNYNSFEAMSNCDDRIICLSERSMEIILQALQQVGTYRTRVWVDREGEHYTIVDDDQWEQWQFYVSDIATQLGGYMACNDLLQQMVEQQTRIANHLESLDEKAQTFITWQELLDDMATTLGIANPFYLLIKAFTDLIPSIKNVKLDPWPMLAALWRSRTFEFPMLAALVGMNTSLGAIAAANVGEAVISKLKLLTEGAALLNTLYSQVRAALVGDWNFLDFMSSIWDWFRSDEDGGDGGEDPDNDPSLRTEVNVATTLINNNAFSCVPEINVHTENCCCGGAGSGAYGPGTGGVDDVPPSSVPEAGYPPSFPNGPTYNLYKCKASNVIIISLAEMLFQIGEKENTDLTQYTTHQAAGAALGIQNTLILHSGGVVPAGLAAWLTEQIMYFLFPYPSELAVGLAIFEGIRLELLSDREEAVCELFNSSSTSGAREVLETRIDGYIDATAFSEDVKTRAKAMYKALLTNSFLGQLFQKNSQVNTYSDSSAIDCTTCTQDCWLGEDIEVLAGQIDISSTTTAEGQYVLVSFSSPTNINVSLLSGSMDAPPTVTDCWTLISETVACVNGACTDPDWTEVLSTHSMGPISDVMTILYRSTSAFTLRITY